MQACILVSERNEEAEELYPYRVNHRDRPNHVLEMYFLKDVESVSVKAGGDSELFKGEGKGNIRVTLPDGESIWFQRGVIRNAQVFTEIPASALVPEIQVEVSPRYGDPYRGTVHEVEDLDSGDKKVVLKKNRGTPLPGEAKLLIKAGDNLSRLYQGDEMSEVDAVYLIGGPYADTRC